MKSLRLKEFLDEVEQRSGHEIIRRIARVELAMFLESGIIDEGNINDVFLRNFIHYLGLRLKNRQELNELVIPNNSELLRISTRR